MVKVLNREGIQRMVGRGAGSGGSGGSSEGGGGISIAQVDAAYVSKDFFNQLFTVHGKRTYTDPDTQEEVTEDVIISPNQIAEGEYSLSNVEVSVGLWTNSFLSALGLNSGGGGGGATALTDLVDVNPNMVPTNNQVLTYDATLGKWTAKDAQGGGGTDMQTVWQALAANTSEQINASHLTNAMLRLDHTYETVDANNLKASGSHRLGDQGSNFPVSSPNYGQMLVVNGGGDTYAQLYFPYTSSDIFIRTGNPDNPSTGQWNAWKKVLTEGNAVTSVGMSVPTGFSVTGSPITSSGTLALSFASGYSLPTTDKQSAWDAKQDAITDLATIRSNAAHGETAYGWGNHAGLYLPLSGGTLTGTTTFNNGCWNIEANEANEISNKHWENNTLYNNDNTVVLSHLASIRNALRFRWYDSYWNVGNIRGGATDSYGFGIAYEDTTNNRLIDCFHVDRYGTINSLLYFRNSSIGIGTSNPQYKLDVNGSIHSGSYVQIGNIRLVYDSNYNALQVIKSDGTAANLYATGGVSALGMSAGVSQLDAMTFNHLKVNNSMTLNGSVNIITGSLSQILRSSNDSDCIYLLNFGTTSKETSHNYYFNQYDNVGLHGTNYNYDDTWFIDPDGCAKFKRLYLDSTRYLYINGGTLYYYNGSTSRQIAFA